MKKSLDMARQIRRNFISLLDDVSLEGLNKIPEKCNNNLLWNFGHIIISQQNLAYKPAGKTPPLPADLLARYSKGSKPSVPISQTEYEHLKTLAFSLLDDFEALYQRGDFAHFTPYETSANITLDTIKTAMHYNVAHENLHYGMAILMKRWVV